MFLCHSDMILVMIRVALFLSLINENHLFVSLPCRTRTNRQIESHAFFCCCRHGSSLRCLNWIFFMWIGDVWSCTNCRCIFLWPTGSSNKRSRNDYHSAPSGQDLYVVVQEQSQEIASLKQDKASLESTVQELRTENERVVNENKILKKAVTIQQERQNHAASELQAATNYKAEAEDRMKKLEQMILTLRYHLQAQQANTPSNDFMGFPPRPPDVFWIGFGASIRY